VKGAVEVMLGCLGDPRLRRLMLERLNRYMGSADSFILQFIVSGTIYHGKILRGYFLLCLTLWRVVSIYYDKVFYLEEVQSVLS